MSFQAHRFTFISLSVLVLLGLSTPRTLEYGQATPTNPRIEGEVVVIRPWGFDPVSLTRPRGKFILIIDNRSGVLDLDLRLDKMGGNRVDEAHDTDHRQHDWVKTVDLEPGDYQLTEAEHPKWVCKITVKPN